MKAGGMLMDQPYSVLSPLFLCCESLCATAWSRIFPCKVYANNDLGLLNFRLHPDWPDTPYGYMLYAHDRG